MRQMDARTFRTSKAWGSCDIPEIEGASDRVSRLRPGDIFHAEAGDAHVAHPPGEARILVV
jgi:hypothetical protein